VTAPGVLGNDTGTGGPLSVFLVSDVSHGTLTLNPDGSFTYVSGSGYAGADSFTYQMTNGTTDSNITTVTINVTNTPPVAGNDTYTTVQGQTLTVSAPGILGNDSDPDGDPLQIADINGASAVLGTPITLPSGAVLTVNANGSLSYTPPSGFVGTDSFTYQDFDGVDLSNTATVTIQVAGGSLGDWVWNDVNQNGIQDSGETGLAGVTVNLLDGQGNPLQSTTTDSTGHYAFNNLPAGNYEERVVAPAGYVFSPEHQGSDPTRDSDADSTGLISPISLSPGQIRTDLDAGLYTSGSGGSIGDWVWNDANQNGIQDTGESGLPGVTVNLLDGLGNWLQSTTTDSTGLYAFNNLAAGNYQVRVVAPTGYVFSPAHQGGDSTRDSDADSSGLINPISLSPGQIRTDLDAGLYSNGSGGSGGSIGDWVWNDTNHNGIQDTGESGLSGVTVNLLDGLGNPLQATTTDSVGHYAFNNLAAGNYEVRVVAPTGYVFSPAHQGGDSTRDSDADSSGLITPISLSAGQIRTDLDAGLYSSGSGGSGRMVKPSALENPGGAQTDAATVGVFDATTGTWYLRDSNGPGAPDFTPFRYGGPDWIPVVGDWDGNGTVTVGVVDPATETWYLKNTNAAGAPDFTPFRYGAPGWIPVVGDWTGSGHTGIGVFDPTTGTWYLRTEVGPGAPDAGTFRYGGFGWVPVAGDWDGNGTTTVGVVNPTTETWYLKNSNRAGAPDVTPFAYGAPGWRPVAGDWNGDGTMTIAVVDPASQTWYLRDRNSPGAPEVAPFRYGAPGWAALGGAWVGLARTLRLAGDAAQAGAGSAPLTGQQLNGIFAAALARLRQDGLSAGLTSQLASTPFLVGQLGGGALALAQPGRVLFDANAAGVGWFVDATPGQDEEFAPGAGGVLQALPDGPAAGHVDLLTAVLQELGQEAGLDSAALTDPLAPGARNTAALDAVFGGP
jgi:hypothetical protein